MKTLRVGLFGGALHSVNYGVTALTLTQLQLLEKLSKQTGIGLEYLVFSDDPEAAVEAAKKLLGLKDLTVKYVVRLKTGLSGLIRLKKDISQCDLIIDLTYGDSLSDIYGKKFFFLYSLPKLMAIKCKKPLILAPQTIGPYYAKPVKSFARYLLKRTDHIVVRDQLSYDCTKEVCGREDMIKTSDLAMDLPFDPHAREQAAFRGENCLHVGLNVSSLLWHKDASNSNLSVTLPYRALVDRILRLAQEKGYRIHLIAHVYETSGQTEYGLAKELSEKYPGTVLAPSFTDPIQAKNYMSALDVFIGARMHATIGAFSSGVPVIPIAYSRKFEGLYRSVGYEYCIDCGSETIESAMEKIGQWLDDIAPLQEAARTASAAAKANNLPYYQLLHRVITELTK